ncbi:MAG TPA: hypothetical protein VLF62_01615 [Candidatus Saccharimonadales bacterium]|nr:hypothetical protein [Candidatus Saccharimonadales bacterium]
MSHKTPDQSRWTFRRRWAYAAILGGAVVAAGGHSFIGGFDKPEADWPGASKPPAADAPYLATPEAKQPGEIHKNMAKSKDPGLKALAAVEKKTGYSFESNMLFAGMPRTPEEAHDQANEMAARLKEYAKQGVKPLVVMEPTYNQGKDLIDTTKLSDAKHADNYRQTMDAYFGGIRQNEAGITDEQMGNWVLFPEPNIPEWKGGNTDPNTFKANYTVAAQAMKAHFRSGHASVMLDSATYPNNDWSQPSYEGSDLTRYVSGIPEGLIDSVGFQGMPYSQNDDPSVFLNAQAAAQLAEAAKTKNIWINTGTYSSYYNEQTKKREQATTAQRAETLVHESQTAATLQTAGFDVSVNVFAAPASSPDAPDWSFKSQADQQMLAGTLKAASAAAIPVSLFVAG